MLGDTLNIKTREAHNTSSRKFFGFSGHTKRALSDDEVRYGFQHRDGGKQPWRHNSAEKRSKQISHQESGLRRVTELSDFGVTV